MQKQSIIQEKLRMFQKANRKTWTEVCQTGQEAHRNGKKIKKSVCIETGLHAGLRKLQM